MQTTIVTATEQEADMIKQLAEDIWWPTYSPILTEEQIRFMLDKIYDVEVLRQQIITGEQTFLILKEEDNPVGFAGYSAYGDNDYKLHKLYCLPQTQGKGYGKLLINTVADTAKKAGAKNLLLNVNRYNKAKSFYEKMGFSILREEDIAIGPFWMNDYIMQKPL